MATKTNKTKAEEVAENVVETAESVTEAAETVIETAENVTEEPKKETKKAAKEAKAAVKSDTVTICLNYPHNVKFNVPAGYSGQKKTYEFNGNAVDLRGKAKGILPVGRFGYTFGVPREVWEYISKTYKNMPLIKNGLLFAAETDAARESNERESLRNGYEPIDPEKAKSEPKK